MRAIVCAERERKGKKEMCGRVNVRSPNKLGLMTLKTSFFSPTVFRANTIVADLKNAINTMSKSLVRQALTYGVTIK